MSHTVLLVRYNELALKGDNRSWFEKCLVKNIEILLGRALKRSRLEDAPIEVRRIHGRILVHLPKNLSSTDHTMLMDTMTRVFGISSFSPMHEVATDLPTLAAACIADARAWFQKHGTPKSFSVRSRRTDKALPETSSEIDRILGSAVREAFPDWPVQLKGADLELGVEIRNGFSYLWTEKIICSDGLPVGSNGPLLTLISGGLDSPVAAIQSLRRGATTAFIHFYGTPFVGEDVLQKVSALVHQINQYQPKSKPLYIVPFGKLQEKIALVTDAKMRTLLYRRMMIRIANQIATNISAQALITGESLGQVASQTLENLSTIDEVSHIPILRPLITYSKHEIVEQAKKWKVFEISIQPGLDCCTLFADRHPILRSTPNMMSREEAAFPVDEWVKEAVEATYILGSKFHSVE